MKKIFYALILCTVLLCGCSENDAEEISEAAVPETSSVTVTTESSATTVTETETTTTGTTSITPAETSASETAADKEQSEYTYSPPAAALDVEFARDNIICRVNYQYYPNDETAELPEYIFADINSYADEYISTAEYESIMERIGVYTFDINSDGLDDYIIIGEIVMENGITFFPYTIEKLYIKDGNGGFDVIDFPASYGKGGKLYDYVLSTKTNGFNDFIGSYEGDISLISFDGNNTYSKSETLSEPYNHRYEYLDNNLAKITVNANGHENEIAVAKFFYDTDRAEHMLLYSSLPDGTPSVSIPQAYGSNIFEFYVKRTDKAPENYYDWGVGPIEIKYIPA